MRRARATILLVSLGAVLAAGGWVAAGPRGLGGAVDYVAVGKGASMEPAFRVGDLALTRRAPGYAVGQVVAARTDYGKIVLHRIVARDRDRFVTKGDNNASADAYHPRSSDILGALWVRIPVAGGIMLRLREPRGIALTATVVAAIAILAGSVHRRRRSRGRRVTGSAPGRLGLERLLGASLAAVVAFGALLAVSFHTPLRAAADVAYAQEGSFDYTARASNDVYGSGAARTGQPVFLRLSRAMDVSFAYRFSTEVAHAVSGRQRLVVELSAPNGWRRPVALTPWTKFSGDGFRASARVDLARMRGLLTAMEQQTGVMAPMYALALVADVQARGEIAGRAFARAYSPALRFQMDAFQVRLDDQGGASTRDATPDGRESGSVRVPGAVEHRLSLGRLSLPVRAARRAGLLGTAAAAIVALFSAWAAARVARAGEPERIHAQFGAVLVPALGEPPLRSYVDIADFEVLRRIADHHDREILVFSDGGGHTYIVLDEESAYRYVARDEGGRERLVPVANIAARRKLSGAPDA